MVPCGGVGLIGCDDGDAGSVAGAVVDMPLLFGVPVASGLDMLPVVPVDVLPVIPVLSLIPELPALPVDMAAPDIDDPVFNAASCCWLSAFVASRCDEDAVLLARFAGLASAAAVVVKAASVAAAIIIARVMVVSFVIQAPRQPNARCAGKLRGARSQRETHACERPIASG